MSDRDYFNRAYNFSIFDKMSIFARRQLFEIFIKNIKPSPNEKIADIGVFGGSEDPNMNFLEQLYQYPKNITAIGVEDAVFLERQYPGLKFVKILANQRLPFNDDEFDIGFSSAVIEHVGSFQDQKYFLEEAIRICRTLFIATPNRFYPIEFHTRLPFLHWLPQPFFRKILKIMNLEFYSKEENLNLLGEKQLLNLMPLQYREKSKLLSYRFLGLVSNLILIVQK